MGPATSSVVVQQKETLAASPWTRRIAIVAGIGIAVRVIVAFVVLPTMPQVEDGPYYSLQASQMLDGTIGHLYFPPGTSLVLAPMYALFGQSIFTDHLLGVLLTSAFMLSGIWLSIVVAGWGKATFIAAIMLALYPHSVMSAAHINSEPLTAALLAVAAGLIIRNVDRWSWRRWIAATVCLAGAMLTRPGSLGVLAVLAVGGVILWKRGLLTARLLSGAAATLVLVLVVSALPFMAHNARVGQGYTLSTNNEWNLFLGNNPHTPDYKTAHFGQREFDELSPEAASYLAAKLPQHDPSRATRAERQAMEEAAVDYILEHPGRTVYRVTNRARAFWGMDYTATRGIQDSYALSDRAAMPLLGLEAGGYLLVLILALAAPFVVPASARARWKILGAFVLAIMLPYLLAFALPKYHLPAIPMLVPIAAFAYLTIVDRPRSSWSMLRGSKLWWVAAAVLLAIQAELTVHLVLLR